MSENKKAPSLHGALTKPEERREFTERDLKELAEFKEEGMPEIGSISPEMLKKIMEFYLEGRNFREISMTLRIKRVMIMYLAQRYKWWEIREVFQEEMQNQITRRVMDQKLTSQTFLLKLVHHWERKMGKQIDSYQRTGEEPIGGVIDFKEIDKYLKTVEVLNKLTHDNSNRPPSSPIGLNVGDGVTIEKNGNTMTISPALKERTVGEMLRQYADARRQEDEA